MLRATAHSLEGLIARLNIDPLKVNRFMEEWLKTARQVTYEEATNVASIFNNNKKNVYYLAPDPLRPGEQVVLITRDERVITLLTNLTNNFYGVEANTRNGKKVIRTLDGDVVNDAGEWIRDSRRRYKKIQRKTR